MQLRIVFPGLLLIAMTIAFITIGCAGHDTSSAPLYQRLGGYDAIAAVVDDFLARMGNDDMLSRHFEGMSEKDNRRTRQLIVDMMCAATGGPCYYTGRDMVTTHTGMGITEEDWRRSADHLVATLDAFKVPDREKGEVMDIISSTKNDIVGH